jgi:hypothetical protein
VDQETKVPAVTLNTAEVSELALGNKSLKQESIPEEGKEEDVIRS